MARFVVKKLGIYLVVLSSKKTTYIQRKSVYIRGVPGRVYRSEKLCFVEGKSCDRANHGPIHWSKKCPHIVSIHVVFFEGLQAGFFRNYVTQKRLEIMV